MEGRIINGYTFRIDKEISVFRDAIRSAETIAKLEKVLNEMVEIIKNVSDLKLKSRMKEVLVMMESDFQFKEFAIREICEVTRCPRRERRKLLTMYRQKSFLNPFVVNSSMRYIRLSQAAQEKKS